MAFIPKPTILEVPLFGFVSPPSSDIHLSKESGLLWKQNASFQWDLVAQQRGIHHIGPSLLRAGDFLGFFSREKKGGEILEIVVYPRLVPADSRMLPVRPLESTVCV